MRGTTLPTGENLVGFYYDYVEVSVENGKKKYGISKLPQKFNFAESSTSAATIFQSTKGLEHQATTFADVYQTKAIKWQIQTSNTEINFKENGVIKVIQDGVEQFYTIRKITNLTSYNKGFAMTRLGSNDMKIGNVPKILLLN